MALASHDVELVASVATRVVMVAGGEIIADGSPERVLGDSHVFAPQMTRVFGPGLADAHAGDSGDGAGRMMPLHRFGHRPRKGPDERC